MLHPGQCPFRSIYGPSFSAFLEASEALASQATTSEEDFAQVILEVLSCAAPDTHYCVGADAAEFVRMARTQGARELDALFSAQMPGREAFAIAVETDGAA